MLQYSPTEPLSLHDYLVHSGLFTTTELDHVLPLFQWRTMRRNEFFVRSGSVCTEVAFISSGLFRSYYTNDAGEELTHCFRFPGDWIAAYSSFLTGAPGFEYLQALTDAGIWVLPKSVIDQQLNTRSEWMNMRRIIAEAQYLELEQRIIRMQRDSAAQRYAVLLQEQPEYLQHIPLQYLASYLGISQRHLSRIRSAPNF